ncbi:uncharacterized protein LOC110094329 [Dendrobium catenatum]|uniref:uncharacterized protein LOC110094329 n=1 Tax=Dendrobium catenatum TaxID=906689 RepID=UPI0009F288D1|nr:uncharacterized protein LOC110094329 [Dendrobium catenatum]
MEVALCASDFPPLGQSSGGPPTLIQKNWTKVFAPEGSAPKAFQFTHHPSEPEIIPFFGENLSKGGEDWTFCLLGYSIGRRPYYEALLGAINKTWSLKGSLKLLSLNDGFFLLKFTCQEDFDMVWSRGVWFLLGKPFVLQKWHPKFTPKKEEFSSVPIWVKTHDLPLACWNSEGISRIASKIGVPVAADKLTEEKSRLTYARICVLVDNKATYPEEIHVSLDGDVVSLHVQYEWRPHPCEHCKSLMHFSVSCPKKINSTEDVSTKQINGTRGRSYSRNARNRNNSRSMNYSRPPTSSAANHSVHNNTAQTSSPDNPPITNAIGQPLHYQPHSPTSQNLPSKIDTVIGDIPSSNMLLKEDAIVSGIPNLNSPNEAISTSSTTLSLKSTTQSKDIISPNKFDALSLEEDNNQQSEDVEEMNQKQSSSVGGKSQKMEKAKQPQASAVSKKPVRGKQNKKPPPHSYS